MVVYLKECGPKDLAAADAIIFGFPTRFGMCCAQMKALLDRTGGLWMKVPKKTKEMNK